MRRRRLPVHTPRQLVPKEIDLGDWKLIAPLFDVVEAKLAAAKSVAELEGALLAWSELSAALESAPRACGVHRRPGRDGRAPPARRRDWHSTRR